MADEGEFKLPLPDLTDENRAFWTGGSERRLLIQRCQACTLLVHPPSIRCPYCGNIGAPIASELSGEATVASFTVNHQSWFPGEAVPDIFAIVTPVEQDDIWLITRLVRCNAETVNIGMPVRVRFEAAGDIWLPLFEPS